MRCSKRIQTLCQRATPVSGEWPCSTKRNTPSAFTTRRTSPRAAPRSGIVQSVQVDKTASKDPDGRSRCSPVEPGLLNRCGAHGRSSAGPAHGDF